ncbi:cation-transporting P-type ATPase [Candidatus Parvarchaeota archaeon]|nr:cation-transporting P-type ATPase [Candidatus Parvarchaeota archaeon]
MAKKSKKIGSKAAFNSKATGQPTKMQQATSPTVPSGFQDWHSIGEKEAISKLGSSTSGLSELDSQSRLVTFGPNKLPEQKPVSPLLLFAQQFKNPMLILLGVAAAVSFFTGHAYDSIGIFFAILLSAIFGFAQEYKAAKELDALKKLSVPSARVIRSGVEKIIQTQLLVPGDIIILDEGSKIPADCRLFESFELSCDESALTGESLPVRKSTLPCSQKTPLAERHCMLYFGTSTVAGRGKAVVTGTGINTEFGKIAKSLETTEEEQTPLQKNMEKLGEKIGLYSLFIVAAYFAIGVFKGFDASTMFISAVTLAVVSIPEGLPTIITITLGIGMQRLARQNALVRKLPAVESLGSVTVICTDKTGTLTENRMTVTQIYTCAGLLEMDSMPGKTAGQNTTVGVKAAKSPREPNTNAAHKLALQAFEVAALCNNASVVQKQSGETVQIGDPTESALLVGALKAGLNVDKLKNDAFFEGEFPFDSKRKRMATVRLKDGKHFVYAKGAPEKILESCTSMLSEKGVEKLTGARKAALEQAHNTMAANALRLISVAYKESAKPQSRLPVTDAESGLVYVGTIGMIDPPRREVSQAIKTCQTAGIKVVMITGDNLLTAKAIAKQIGLIHSDSQCTSGQELDGMSDEALGRVVKEVCVYARTSPQHKYRIVQALIKNGEIVAVTGDGVNDAPAIKKANVGISMGSGTDVSKEAADVVLTDDNFATIVNAVAYGRNLFDNIKNYLRFQFSTNFSAIITMLCAPLLGLGLPLLPLQALWVNIIMDGPPALALGVEKANPGIMERKPAKPGAGFITRNLVYNIAIGCIFMSLGTLAVLYLVSNSKTEEARRTAQTMAFTVFVFFQLFNALNCKSSTVSLSKNLLSNKSLLAATGVCALLQIAIVYLPPMQAIFGTVALLPFELGLAVLISLGIIAVGEATKIFMPKLMAY